MAYSDIKPTKLLYVTPKIKCKYHLKILLKSIPLHAKLEVLFEYCFFFPQRQNKLFCLKIIIDVTLSNGVSLFH